MDPSDRIKDAPASSLIPEPSNMPPQSDDIRLPDLIAQATGKYAMKDYSSAAELYSQATELQASMNGEMAVENADLLYSYGKCLYFVAVSNSEVLGSKVAGEVSNKDKKHASVRANGQASKSSKKERVAEEAVAQIVADKVGAKPEEKQEEEQSTSSNQPYFQFTGDDENWDTSDEDGEDEDVGNEEAEEEEDDFANAFEMLDIARILLLRKLDSLSIADDDTKGKGKGKAPDRPEVRQVKERLADTHDLQAEISLEGEKFPNAVIDLRAALALKQGLFPESSSVIAECHYKLSLALEFSSVTQQKDEHGNVNEQETRVDEEMRTEAAGEMEAAINSCKLRIENEEAQLSAMSEGKEIEDEDAASEERKKVPSQRDIDDVKEMVADMEQRLLELQRPPVSINDPTSTGALDGANPLSGILGQILGESPAQQKARLEEASKNANDLSGLVKKKKPATSANTNTNGATNGTKRKVGFAEEIVELGSGKKAKVEDADAD